MEISLHFQTQSFQFGIIQAHVSVFSFFSIHSINQWVRFFFLIESLLFYFQVQNQKSQIQAITGQDNFW